eukprot:TRINITY_DN632_c1_g1_i2.p1 TRINITY_DN632_c1_g1~~TRINITY_DN632_c1_g1_i2.p1  ORF type:complete len:275 (-),score=139.47 TRINITY_DN632_c1_g1_i2:353-1177(-)
MAIMKVVLVGLLAVLASAVADDQEDSIHFEVIFEACNFEDADSDKDGFATVADFQVLMKDAGLGDDEKDFYRKLLVTADTNKDGKLNKEEFDAAVTKYSQFQPAHMQAVEPDADKEAAEADKDDKVSKEESDSADSEYEPSFLQTEEQDENEDKDEEEDKVENDDALSAAVEAAVEEDDKDPEADFEVPESEPSFLQTEEQDENEDKDEEEDKVEDYDALPADVEEDDIDSEPSLAQAEEQDENEDKDEEQDKDGEQDKDKDNGVEDDEEKKTQ